MQVSMYVAHTIPTSTSPTTTIPYYLPTLFFSASFISSLQNKKGKGKGDVWRNGGRRE